MATSQRRRPTSRALRAQASLSEKSVRLFTEALEKESVLPSEAVRLYRQGIQALSEALKIPFTPADQAQANVLIEKMRKNLSLIEPRLKACLERTVATDLDTVYDNSLPYQPHAASEASLASLPSPPTPTSFSASPAPSPYSSTTSAPSATQFVSTSQPSPVSVPTATTTEPNPSAEISTDDHSRRLSALKGVPKEYQRIVLNDIVDDSPGVRFSDIAGLEQAKRALKELVILPSLRPDLFTGLRSPPRGLLLFGPPGNGKTMIAKAVASEAKCTFFAVSACTFTSRYLGDSEKIVKALFAIARALQPSLVFIDEIDSILGARGDNEHEAMRRLKTEFMVQFDGVQSLQEDRVLIMAATNRPMDIDSAVIRRMPRRIFISLPDYDARSYLVKKMLRKQNCALHEQEFAEVAEMTEGYSGADIAVLCRDAAMQAIRELDLQDLEAIDASAIRSISFDDVCSSFRAMRPSVDQHSLKPLVDWNERFGSVAF